MEERSIEVYYDGACPVCVREATRLARLDKHDRLAFQDIAAADFDGSSLGIPAHLFAQRLHARLADGTVVHSMEAFRHLYSAVGFGAVVWLTRIPGISQVLDAMYRWYAGRRNRRARSCSDGCAR